MSPPEPALNLWRGEAELLCGGAEGAIVSRSGGDEEASAEVAFAELRKGGNPNRLLGWAYGFEPVFHCTWNPSQLWRARKSGIQKTGSKPSQSRLRAVTNLVAQSATTIIVGPEI